MQFAAAHACIVDALQGLYNSRRKPIVQLGAPELGFTLVAACAQAFPDRDSSLYFVTAHAVSRYAAEL